MSGVIVRLCFSAAGSIEFSIKKPCVTAGLFYLAFLFAFIRRVGIIIGAIDMQSKRAAMRQGQASA